MNASRSVRRRAASGLLRCVQHLLLFVGLAGAGYCCFVYGKARAYQVYEGWRLDRILQHRSASLRSVLSSDLDRWWPQATEQPNSAPAQLPINPAWLPALLNAPQTMAWPLAPAPPPKGSLIGRLEIPRLGISTVVLEGDSDDVLEKAAGHIPGTALPGLNGNVAVAAHRDSFFRPLRRIRRNDKVTLVAPGATYRYRVDSIEIVKPDDVEVLKASGSPSLTLVTCYPFYFVGSAPDRFIVRAEQVEPVPDSKPVPEANHAPATAPSQAKASLAALRGPGAGPSSQSSGVEAAEAHEFSRGPADEASATPTGPPEQVPPARRPSPARRAKAPVRPVRRLHQGSIAKASPTPARFDRHSRHASGPHSAPTSQSKSKRKPLWVRWLRSIGRKVGGIRSDGPPGRN